MTEKKVGPTHAPRLDEETLRKQVEALKTYNAQLRAEQEIRRMTNRRLAGRDEPLTESEKQVFELQKQVHHHRADSGTAQRHAKVVRRRERGTLTEAWDGSWQTAKGRWTEE